MTSPIGERAESQPFSGLVWAALIMLAAVAGFGLSTSRMAGLLDEELRLWRDAAVARPASGAVHIAEIDARSIAALDTWPWPRDIHARLIDRLRAAGARTIAFDVDFSAASLPGQDRALRDALARAGDSVILPTFRQRGGGGHGDFVENLPLEMFREHAALASVNVHPDADGMMRRFSFGTVTRDVPRPAMPAMLAGASGSIGSEFTVSTAIDPDTVPRHSVSDLLNGAAPNHSLRGKTVLIGATAVELGDRYAMPRHGVQPGVVIQALATETLLQGLALPNLGAFPALIAALVALAGLMRVHRKRLAIGLVVLMAIAAAPLGLEIAGVATLDVAAGLFLLGTSLALLAAADAAHSFRTLRLVDPETGLGNERAFKRLLAENPHGTVVSMRIRGHEEIAALTGEDQRRALVEQIRARVGLAEPAARIFSVGNGGYAWRMPDGDLQAIADGLDALAALFAQRLTIGAHRVLVTPVFGLAVNDADGDALARAELALARAATQGSRWSLWTNDLGDAAGRDQRLLADLEEAMESGAISLVYQPKLAIATNRIDGVEALVRWHHAELGPIPPDHFIPLLETHGRLQALTLFIVDRCLEVAQRWQSEGRDLSIAINMSAPLLSDRAFVATLIARFEMAGALAGRIGLEVTESAVVLDDATMIASLNALRAIGIAIAIDDYGTGQSTLTYLKRFPADEIKIDKSFVRTVADGGSDEILVRSTIAMAHELGLTVVAEGVEDAHCLARLAALGCDRAQGWHIGKGMPIAEFEEMFEASLEIGKAVDRDGDASEPGIRRMAHSRR